MATQLSISQTLVNRNLSLEERIQGSQLTRIVQEFVSTSALFPILDAIRGISTVGWLDYLSEPAHYVLFAAACVQAWFLGTSQKDSWQVRLFGNLLAFSLYAPLDMVIDGLGFFAEPYHWLFGAFSLLMGLLNALQVVTQHRAIWQIVITLLLNIGKILLFPAMYLIIELHLELPSQLTWQAWQEYMTSSGHKFIFYGALFFGALLGLAEAQRNGYARFLRYLAQQLKKYSEWSLASELIEDAIDNPQALQLQRVEKTILFMDIRGFTAWSEQADPRRVVQMLNQFYNAAEAVITRHQGHKPNFTADEIMTRFATPEAALGAALDLQKTLKPLLTPYNLAVGVGLHTGEVIEGLMGSDTTRKYDIIGDAANTAKRLESSAGRGEILLSADTYQALTHPPSRVESRALRVKGKSDTLLAYAIHP